MGKTVQPESSEEYVFGITGSDTTNKFIKGCQIKGEDDPEPGLPPMTRPVVKVICQLGSFGATFGGTKEVVGLTLPLNEKKWLPQVLEVGPNGCAGAAGIKKEQLLYKINDVAFSAERLAKAAAGHTSYTLELVDALPEFKNGDRIKHLETEVTGTYVDSAAGGGCYWTPDGAEWGSSFIPVTDLFKLVKLNAPEDGAGTATDGDAVAAIGGNEGFGETITFGDKTLCVGDLVVTTDTFCPELARDNNPHCNQGRKYMVMMLTAVEAQENDRILLETADIDTVKDWVERSNGKKQFWLKKHELDKFEPGSSGGYS